MTRALIIRRASPGMTVQDRGRPGYLRFGLSRGGAADALALAEGAALLGQDPGLAALEMAGMGGEFEVTEPTRIALTGATMRARIGDDTARWNASHLLHPGQRLTIGAADAGVYGYLHLGGGLATRELLGSRSAHLAAGIGTPVESGQSLALGPDPATRTGMKIDPAPRFGGGMLRIVPSLQTGVFPESELARFQATTFTRDARGNRMGVRIIPEGDGFHADTGLTILSEVIVPGDIQITGDGTPFVLLTECQTTGGYPRIGSVLPTDMPIVAQTPPGKPLTFRFVTLAEGVEIERAELARRRALPGQVTPIIRDPGDIPDLLSYQLIGGVTAGDFPD